MQSAKRAILWAYSEKGGGLGDIQQPRDALVPCCSKCGHAGMESVLVKRVRSGGQLREVYEWTCSHCAYQTRRRPKLARGRVGGMSDNTRAPSSNCNSIWAGLEKGQIQAAVESQPSPHVAILKYLYTDGQVNYGAFEMTLLDWVILRLDETPPRSFRSLAAARLAVHLTLLLIHNVRSLECCGMVAYSDAELARRVFGDEEKRCNFKSGYPWDRYCVAVYDHLWALDREARAPVDALLDRWREAKRVA